MFFAAFFLLFLILWGVVYAALPAVRGAVSYAARAIVRNARVAKLVETHGERLRDYWPVVAVLVIGAALTAWAGDGFLDLAEMVHDKSPGLQQMDVRVHDWVVSHRDPPATLFFTVMTLVGSPAGVGAIAGIVAIVLLIKRRYRWVAYLAVTAGGGGLLNMELKRYFARARPDVAHMLRVAHGYSFPSGHAMGSMVVFGALAYLAARSIPQWKWQAAAIALAIVLVLSISFSRVYLGVHWLSDIVAGITAGAVWVTSTTVAYETLRYIRRRHPERGEG
jgi:membrane-associated phospholipid phosphatase